MDRPFPAYKGSDAYIFVCYAHRDAESVYADLTRLREAGVNIWYDEGIPAGTSWRGEIAEAIKGASKLLLFISSDSLNSKHCLREVDYALSHDIDIIPVYLDDIALPPELDLVLSRVQGLFRFTDARYMEHLVAALKDGGRLEFSARKRKSSLYQLAIPALVVLVLAAWGMAWSFRDGVPESTVSSTDPGSFDLYLEGMDLMERWDKDDNLDKAIDLFVQSIALSPDFALAYARLADAQRIQFALTDDQSWLDMAINNADQAMSLNARLAPVQVVSGKIQQTLGNYDLAFAAVEEALRIDPNDVSANQAMGSLYDSQGRLEDAEASFKRAVALEPENLRALDSYANFLFRHGRYDEAITQWRAVLRLAPDLFTAILNMGSALSDSGRIAEAITMYERANDIRPMYMGYSNLGTAYFLAGRYDDAVNAFENALAITDTDWLAWGNLAYTYSWMDGMETEASSMFDRAIRLAEEAREQSPRDPYVNSDLALYYAKTGNEQQSLQRIETALALSPDTGEILAAATEIYELLGRRNNALEMYRRALENGYPAQKFLSNPELSDLLASSNL